MNKKRYKRASEYYEKGELDKALSECEKGISESLKDSSLLNLKGIILYQRGNLSEALITWSVNKDFNNDELSKVYIRDSKSDEERKQYYIKGEQSLKELKIDDALMYLEKCKETSFNEIKVNAALALCYFKKGLYNEGKFYAFQALKIDRNYITAKQIVNEINSLNSTEKYNKKYVLVALIIGLILVVGVVYVNSNKIEGQEPPIIIENQENDKKETEQNIEESPLDISLINGLIKEKDMDNLYNNLKDVDRNKVLENQKHIVDDGFALLSNEGVDKFYSDGLDYIKQEEYENADNELSKAYSLGKEHYLYPHIVYLKGVVMEKLSDGKGGIKYYEEYVDKYNEGAYIEEVLYKLSLLNKSINKDKSKKYAKRLNKDYPKSIYNNSNIKEIIEE